MRRCCCLALWVLLQAALVCRAAPAVDTATDVALEARVQALAAELRCLVCQNQSLADSYAGLAVDLKNQVREQLRAGRSEREVVDYMTARYGDFVLYRPPLKGATLLLWGGPALLVLLGAVLLLQGLRARRPSGDTSLTASEQGRADELLIGRGSHE